MVHCTFLGINRHTMYTLNNFAGFLTNTLIIISMKHFTFIETKPPTMCTLVSCTLVGVATNIFITIQHFTCLGLKIPTHFTLVHRPFPSIRITPTIYIPKYSFFINNMLV